MTKYKVSCGGHKVSYGAASSKRYEHLGREKPSVGREECSQFEP